MWAPNCDRWQVRTSSDPENSADRVGDTLGVGSGHVRMQRDGHDLPRHSLGGAQIRPFAILEEAEPVAGLPVDSSLDTALREAIAEFVARLAGTRR